MIPRKKLKRRLLFLLQRRVYRENSVQEEQELMRLLADPRNEAIVKEVLAALEEDLPETYQLSESTAAHLFRQILQAGETTAAPARKPVARRIRTAAFAAVACVLLTGGWRWLNRKNTPAPVVVSATTTHDVAPGGNRATLTLADGTSIVLDEAGNGMLGRQGNTNIVKLDNGRLAYRASGSNHNNGQVLYNTIITPRGGQYQLLLPDGSKVWLNAASALRFPASFTGAERVVELTGEGYFEVAHTSTAAPFKVKVNDAMVEVLGTHFNINAYPDEKNMHTTLLEGAVKVTRGKQSGLLKPGEDAALSNTGDVLNISEADTESAVAWKNGIFSFHGDDVPTVMRQLSRWYNVEVSYEGAVPQHRFEGRIWRSYTLAQTLAVLQATDIHFRIENRKLVVLP